MQFSLGGLICSLHVSAAESPLAFQSGLSATLGSNYAIKEQKDLRKVNIVPTTAQK